MKHIITAILMSVGMISTAFAQQTINIIGDSYVANHRRPIEETWHYKMAQQLGMIYNNYGRNGSCVAFDRTHDGKYNFGPALWMRYKDMASNADYVIIIGGHNDAGKVKTSKDTLQMFRDSLEVLLCGIEKHCPQARIGYVTPWYVDSDGFTEVVTAIRDVCQRHNVPVLDNYNDNSIIKVRDSTFRKKYFQKPNDTPHLNDNGHNLLLTIGKSWFEREPLKK